MSTPQQPPHGHGYGPPPQGPGAPGPGGRWPPGPGGQPPHPQWSPPPARHRNAGKGNGALIAVIVGVLSVVLIGGLAGGWLLLNRESPSAKAKPSLSPATKEANKTQAAVKLRAITGDQLCAAVPDDLRKPMVADARYGGKSASTGAATPTEKRAACTWTNNKMDVGGGVLGHRSLSISVKARSSDRQNAITIATDTFDQDKKAHERRVNVRDGKRVDGRTSGSAFGELKPLEYGDTSYSQSSIGHSGLKAAVYVRQGPWLIEVTYGGTNRTGAKYPSGDETRAATGKVAALITAEMAKNPDKVKLTGPCAIVTAKHVESAFFRTAGGPSVGTNEGSIKHTTCTWSIREAVKHQPGQEFTARGGELNIRMTTWDGGAAFQFDRDAKKYDRYRAKGGIGNDRTHTTYEPRLQLSGLGDKAFAVVSTTTRPYDKNEPPSMDILVKVLTGDRTVEFTFRGTTTGGGLPEAAGYQAPSFEPQVAQRALTTVAKTFLNGLD